MEMIKREMGPRNLATLEQAVIDLRKKEREEPKVINVQVQKAEPGSLKDAIKRHSGQEHQRAVREGRIKP